MTLSAPLLAVSLLLTAPADTPWDWQPVRASDTQVLAEAKAAITLRSPSRAEELLRPVLVRDPACGPCRATLARALLFQNKANQALELLSALAAEHPEREQLQVEVAWAAFSAQRFDVAQREALAAVGKQPNNPDALDVLVQTLVRTGDLDLAERMVKRVEKHHAPEHVACLRVTLFAERRQVDAAAKALEQCRKHHDDHLVGAAEHRLAIIAKDGARFLSDRSQRLAEASPSRKVNQAVALHQAGRLKQAESVLVPYVKRFPKDLYARGVLGVVRLDLGKKEAAKRDLEACLSGKTWIATAADGSLSGILTLSAEEQLFVNLQRFATSLARLHLEAGDLNKAQEAVDAGARLHHETPDLIEARARLLFASNKPKLAWRTLADGMQRHEESTLLKDTASAYVHKTPGAPRWVQKRLDEAKDWKVLFNLAVEDQHAERWPACVKHAQSAAQAAKTDDALKTRALLLTCAVEAKDNAVVAPLLDDDAVVNEKPMTVLRHAYFLSAEGKSDLALAAALRLPAEGEVGQQRAAAAATYHTELGQLDEAKALLTGKDADPETLLFVGSTFLNAEREQEGQAMIKRACRRANKRMKTDCKRLR